MSVQSRLSGLLGSVRHMAHEIAEKVEQKQRGRNSRMLRATDRQGNEYLCPTKYLDASGFIDDRHKSQCFDYSKISEHVVD